MKLSRREFLRIAGLVSASTVAAGCAPIYNELSNVPSPLSRWPSGKGRRFDFLRRLTYGPTLEERSTVQTMSGKEWLEVQLNPDGIADDGAEWRLRNLESLERDADDLARWDEEQVIMELKQASIIRKVFSARQLYEMMVEFWTDHFNISVRKGDCWFLKPVDDREVIRRHALGNFRDLLWSSAHSPAMLVYLDNQANIKQAPNENYAREVMELHTLGVEGGYSQTDVMELARSLTGWGVKDHFWKGQFRFSSELHDLDQKAVLNMSVEPAGQQEAERVLDLLAVHPSTARHIVVKLARRFLSDNPLETHPKVVDEASKIFNRTRGDIQSVLKTILELGLLHPESELEPKFKRPMDFIVSALRMLHADMDGGQMLQSYAHRMGQSEFEWATPDGPPDIQSYWSNNLLPRWQLAYDLASNQLAGTEINLTQLIDQAYPSSPGELLRSFSILLLGRESMGDEYQAFSKQLGFLPAGVEEILPQAILAGLLASPAFQWR